MVTMFGIELFKEINIKKGNCFNGWNGVIKDINSFINNKIKSRTVRKSGEGIQSICLYGMSGIVRGGKKKCRRLYCNHIFLRKISCSIGIIDSHNKIVASYGEGHINTDSWNWDL